MARPRKPTTVLELTGRLKHNRKRYQDRAREPVENTPLGDPPTRLGATEREVWDELKGRLVEGVALNSDATAFEGLVMLEARRRENRVTGSELALWKQLLSLFGMTPADRSRVSAPAKGKTANPFAKIG